MTTTPRSSPPLASRRGRVGTLHATPAALGLPDPRPVTDYTADMILVGGPGPVHSRLVVTLAQPCVVRTPRWNLVSVMTGERLAPIAAAAVSTTVLHFDFPGIAPPEFAFVDVPYQDTHVQNAQGGFVTPGAKWFRDPTPP
jgi:hypothetical protein